MNGEARARPAVEGRGALVLLGLALAAAVAAGATREVVLRQPPFWSRDSTLVAANVGLLLIAALQMVRGLVERRRKFRLVREAQDQAPEAGAPPRAPAAPAPAVVRCGGCAQPLRVAATPRPLRFRCPKCGTVGVAA